MEQIPRVPAEELYASVAQNTPGVDEWRQDWVVGNVTKALTALMKNNTMKKVVFVVAPFSKSDKDAEKACLTKGRVADLMALLHARKWTAFGVRFDVRSQFWNGVESLKERHVHLPTLRAGLAQATWLTELTLSCVLPHFIASSQVVEEFVGVIAQVAQMPNLRKLDVSGNRALGNCSMPTRIDDLGRALGALGRLEELNFDRCAFTPAFWDRMLKAGLVRVTTLRSLDLGGLRLIYMTPCMIAFLRGNTNLARLHMPLTTATGEFDVEGACDWMATRRVPLYMSVRLAAIHANPPNAWCSVFGHTIQPLYLTLYLSTFEPVNRHELCDLICSGRVRSLRLVIPGNMHACDEHDDFVRAAVSSHPGLQSFRLLSHGIAQLWTSLDCTSQDHRRCLAYVERRRQVPERILTMIMAGHRRPRNDFGERMRLPVELWEQIIFGLAMMIDDVE